jgi:predicted transcriptional regulator of viral defense system
MKSKTQPKKSWKALREALSRRTSISHAEISTLVKKHTDVAVDYAIWRLQQEGVLIRSRRGLYLVAERGEREAFLTDPIEAIRSLLGKDIVFGYGTALYLHGLSRYGRLSEYYVLSPQDAKPKRIGDVLVRFIESPLGDTVGIKQQRFGRSTIRVTDLERTLIDCIHRSKYTQGWENVVHALHRVTRVNTPRLIEYVKSFGIPLLVARVGVVLEYFKEPWKVRTKDIDSLLPYLPRRPVNFDRGLSGTLNKKWNVYVPEGHLDQ